MATATKKDGGPAFPRGSSADPKEMGMSLRDWFAGQALTGLMAQEESPTTKIGPVIAGLIASNCYRVADAMLAEREK